MACTEAQIMSMDNDPQWCGNSDKKPTAFERAYDIIMKRSEDPDRKYGDIDTNFEKTAVMASIMTGKTLTAEDCFAVMFCLKMARESNHHKADNFVDAIAYLGALANYKDKHAR